MCAPRTPPRLERLHTLAIYWASAETGAAHFQRADNLAHAAAAPYLLRKSPSLLEAADS